MTSPARRPDRLGLLGSGARLVRCDPCGAAFRLVAGCTGGTASLTPAAAGL